VFAKAHYLDVTSLPDINGNDSPELAALRILPDGTPSVVIKDSDDGRRIGEITISPYVGTPTGLAAVPDISGNRAPEIAVLFVKPNGQALVKLVDARTGDQVKEMTFFGPKWEPKSIASSVLDGVPEISVLAEKRDGTQAAVQAKVPSIPVGVHWIGFPLD